MDKFDEHGFYAREWAEQNIPGFNELGTCCQQEVLLFPDVPVPCLTSLELDVPAPVIPVLFDPEEVDKARHFGPGVVLIGGGSGGAEPHHSVPEPAVGLLLITAMAAILIARRIRT